MATAPQTSERSGIFSHGMLFGMFLGGIIVLLVFLAFFAMANCFITIGGTFCKV